MNKVWITAILLTSTYVAEAQQLPLNPPPAPSPSEKLAGGPEKRPAPPKGPEGPDLRKGPERPDQRKKPMQEEALKLTTLKGTVVNPVANDRYEYNGLLLKTDRGNVTATFPPHLGEQILDKAKNGSAVTITGFDRMNPEGKREFHLVSLNANGSIIADAPPVAPPLATAQQQKTVTATVKTLNYAPNKDVNGFTLSSGERVSIPPHIAQQLSAQLKPGETITVNGFAEPKRPGVRYSQNVNMIKAQTLSIKGQAYLIR